jgi:hypothetical protein
LSRIARGTCASIPAKLISVSIAIAIAFAVPLMLLTGYLGGCVDGVLMRMIDPMPVIPLQTSWMAPWPALAMFNLVPSFNRLDGLGGPIDSCLS